MGGFIRGAAFGTGGLLAVGVLISAGRPGPDAGAAGPVQVATSGATGHSPLALLDKLMFNREMLILSVYTDQKMDPSGPASPQDPTPGHPHWTMWFKQDGGQPPLIVELHELMSGSELKLLRDTYLQNAAGLKQLVDPR